MTDNTPTDEYTPTTEQVRAVYVIDGTRLTNERRGADFDRWLAAHDAAIRAERDPLTRTQIIDILDGGALIREDGNEVVIARQGAEALADALLAVGGIRPVEPKCACAHAGDPLGLGVDTRNCPIHRHGGKAPAVERVAVDQETLRKIVGEELEKAGLNLNGEPLSGNDEDGYWPLALELRDTMTARLWGVFRVPTDKGAADRHDNLVQAETMEEAAGIAYKRNGGYETGIDLSERAASFREAAER